MAVASRVSLALPIRAIHDQEMHRPDSDRQRSTLGNFYLFRNSSATIRGPAKTKAAPGNPKPKPKPKGVICTDCDGNGAVLCSQCKGCGVNIEDVFNGQFKAGESCWLCGGKKEMLCGNCNGAGFIGGFMSTFDE